MAWKKPKWVQKAQTAASNVAKPVAQVVQKAVPPPPPAPKVIQNIQKAADKVGNVVKQAPAKAIQAVQDVVQRPKNETTNFEFMPYFTKILPDAIGDTARGTGRALLGALTADTDKIVSGAGMVGRGAWDATKHGIMGALPFAKAATTTTEPTMGGGRSGGAATAAIPAGEEDTDDVLPPGAQGNSKIGVPREPDGTPIPPVVTSGGSYLTNPQARARLASMKMPASSKKIRRR